jgi:spore coat protein CotF
MMNYNRNMQQQRQGQSQGQGQGQQANFGAHEVMEAHEVLTDTIDGINQIELYRPHVQDQRLAQILDNQLNALVQGYNNIVNYLSQSGNTQAIPYRSSMNTRIKYGLRNPASDAPNTNWHQMNDQDVASGTLGCHKASAIVSTIAALECADQTLRNMLTTCAQNHTNMAFEVFQFMNERGYYQVPTMQQNTTQTMIDSYQPAAMSGMASGSRNVAFNRM